MSNIQGNVRIDPPKLPKPKYYDRFIRIGVIPTHSKDSVQIATVLGAYVPLPDSVNHEPSLMFYARNRRSSCFSRLKKGDLVVIRDFIDYLLTDEALHEAFLKAEARCLAIKESMNQLDAEYHQGVANAYGEYYPEGSAIRSKDRERSEQGLVGKIPVNGDQPPTSACECYSLATGGMCNVHPMEIPKEHSDEKANAALADDELLADFLRDTDDLNPKKLKELIRKATPLADKLLEEEKKPKRKNKKSSKLT